MEKKYKEGRRQTDERLLTGSHAFEDVQFFFVLRQIKIWEVKTLIQSQKYNMYSKIRKLKL